MALFIVIGVVAVGHLLMALLLPFNRVRTRQLPRYPKPSGAASHAPSPSVYALVPARNEEANIGDCVRALLSQDYPNLRVRVIDDHSTDRTAAIVKEIAQNDPRLELMSAPDLPKGWLGKPHALHAGTRGLSADYFLFVDADLRALPHAVSSCVAALEESNAGLLTLVPRLVSGSFFERAVQPVIAQILFSLIDPKKVENPDSEVAVGYGPFMFFRRSAYQAIGGHASVATEVVEDLRLAQRIKAERLGLAYAHGPGAITLRMYDSLRGLINGWKKNFHVALGSALFLAPILAALIVLFFAGPTLFLLGGAVNFLVSGGAAAEKLLLASGLAYAADLIGRFSLSRNYGCTLRGSRAIGGLIVAYILCISSYQAAMGRPVVWRGRAY
jgi:cellulose synthase/poly-beta-1,6-N-acetylglucosamine synthase-like glycosyltransferase